MEDKRWIWISIINGILRSQLLRIWFYTGNVKYFNLPAFYFSHIVNAYESCEGNNVSVNIDICGHDEPPHGLFDEDITDYIKRNDCHLIDGRVRRVSIDRKTSNHSIQLYQPRTDCLVINPSYISYKIRYSYGEHVTNIHETGAQSLYNKIFSSFITLGFIFHTKKSLVKMDHD